MAGSQSAAHRVLPAPHCALRARVPCPTSSSVVVALLDSCLAQACAHSLLFRCPCTIGPQHRYENSCCQRLGDAGAGCLCSPGSATSAYQPLSRERNRLFLVLTPVAQRSRVVMNDVLVAKLIHCAHSRRIDREAGSKTIVAIPHPCWFHADLWLYLPLLIHSQHFIRNTSSTRLGLCAAPTHAPR